MEPELKSQAIQLEDVDVQHKVGDVQESEILRLGAEVALREGRNPWKVLFENKKLLLLIIVVQVGWVMDW
jgi:hypothetical protein